MIEELVRIGMLEFGADYRWRTTTGHSTGHGQTGMQKYSLLEMPNGQLQWQ